MRQALSQLTPDQSFAVVAYSTGMTVFQGIPVRATRDTRTQAVAWLDSLTAMGWTCITPGVRQCIAWIEQSPAASVALVLIGDGVTTCGSSTTMQGPEATALLRKTDLTRVQVNTVFLGRQGAPFYRGLSAEFGGVYAERVLPPSEEK